MPLAVSHSLHLESNDSSQSVEGVCKQELVCLVELVAHHVQVCNGKCQQFALVVFGLNGELSLQTFLVGYPSINVEVIILNKAAYNVNSSEVTALEQFNVHDILVSRQNITCVAVLQKIYALDVVSLEIYELFLVYHQGLQ